MNILQRILNFFGFELRKKEVKIVKKEIALKKIPVIARASIEYVVGELVKVVDYKDQNNLYKSFIDKFKVLNLLELKVLVKLISKHYRDNAIYDYLFEKELEWIEKEVKIEDIYLTKINEKTNVYLDNLSKPYNLLDLIQEYKRARLPHDFELFKFDSRSINFYPICFEEENKVYVLDGNHRICVKVIREDKKKLLVFLGIKI